MSKAHENDDVFLRKLYGKYLVNATRKCRGQKYTDELFRVLNMFLSFMEGFCYGLASHFFHLSQILTIQETKKKDFTILREDKIFDGCIS